MTNINNSILQSKDRVGKKDPSDLTIADRVTSFVGSWHFFFLNLAWILTWILINVLTNFKFDPYPFIFLNLIIGIEATTMTPLILISQNRMNDKDEKRDDADFEADIRSRVLLEQIAKDMVDIKAKAS